MLLALSRSSAMFVTIQRCKISLILTLSPDPTLSPVRRDITDEDVAFVQDKFKEYLGEASGIDPDALAKAISVWEEREAEEVSTKP